MQALLYVGKSSKAATSSTASHLTATSEPPTPPSLVEPEISLDTLWTRVRGDNLSAPACFTGDWNLIASFYTESAKLKREVCDGCNEIGFNMKLQHEDSKAICDRELTMAEEMLIARAHVQMDISRVKGCQYKYKGHLISWMQNIH